jgi:hypothetical protein
VESVHSKKEIYDVVKRATVGIVMEIPNRLPQRPFTIIGSGFCIHPEGIVVTCEHVFRAFFDEEAYKEIIQSLPEITNPKAIERKHIKQQPQVMFFAGMRGTQVFMPMVGITDAVSKTNFDLTVFKLPKHKAFPNGYPTIPVAEPASHSWRSRLMPFWRNSNFSCGQLAIWHP